MTFPLLTSQPPPVPPPSMASAAVEVGVPVEVVDGRSRDMFEGDPLRPRGPIANALDGRMTGSAKEVSARAAEVASAAEPVLDERTSGTLAP